MNGFYDQFLGMRQRTFSMHVYCIFLEMEVQTWKYCLHINFAEILPMQVHACAQV